MYLDLVMLFNFGVDFLLLIAACRLGGVQRRVGNLALAAATGAIYSGGCMLPGFSFLTGLHWRLICLAFMCLIAFGTGRLLWKLGALYLLLSLALGGMAVLAWDGDMAGVLLGALGLWCLCRLCLSYASTEQRFLPLEVTLGSRTISMTALLDTGNCLRDPVTGERVYVIGREQAQALTGLGFEQLAAPMQTILSAPIPGLRLIPYQAVGQDCGIMLALRCSEMRVAGKVQRGIVAFSPNSLESHGFQALIGGYV